MGQRKIGVLLSYAAMFTHIIVGFLYVPILLHYIGTDGYGLYQLIGSFMMYLSVIYSALSVSVVRFYSRYRALNACSSQEKLLGSALKIYGVLLAVLVGLGLCCYSALENIFGMSLTAAELAEAKQLFLILLFNMCVTIVTVTFRSVIMANEKFLFLKGMELLQIICQPVCVILILRQYPQAISVACAQTGLNILLSASVLYYCFVKLRIKISWHGLPKSELKEFARLAVSLLVTIFVEQLFYQTNPIVLGSSHGTRSVAVYSIAALVYLNYRGMAGVITDIFSPHISALVARQGLGKEITAAFIRVGRVQYFILLLVLSGFVLFGAEFIALWAGDGFGEAYWIAIIIMLPVTLGVVQGVGGLVLQALNQYGVCASLYTCMGVINFILANFSGRFWGGLGCACTMGACILVYNLLMMRYYKTIAHIEISAFWRQVRTITCVGAGTLVVGMLLNAVVPGETWTMLGAKISIYIFLYAGMMWRWAANEEEKQIVRKMIFRNFAV